MWDDFSNGAGLLNAHTVQLWTDGGTLLASATVDNSSTVVASADSTGRWLFTSITPLSLGAGTYRIAVGYGVDGDDPVRFGSVSVTSIGATFVQEAFSSAGTSTTAFPANAFTDPLFGANLELASSAPEPSTAWAMLFGLGVLGVASRVAKKRA
jgi:hypothetical protein